MRSALFLLATGTLIQALSILSAASFEIQSGLWELTTKVEHDGVVSARPARSRCVTASAAILARTKTDFDISAGSRAKLAAHFGHDACKLLKATNSRELMTWRLQCTGKPSAEQFGAVRFDSPRHYTLTIQTSITAADKTATSIVTVEGQHKGECRR